MSPRPVVVIPADDPALIGRSTHLPRLREFADVRLFSDRPIGLPEMLERLQDADVLLNSRSAVRVTGELLKQLPNLKMIAVCGIGYDSIDTAAASARGIVVSNIPGRTATIVAEHTLALMFAVARKIPFMTERLREGQWSAELGLSLIGRRVGVIGTGNIGCETIRLCRAFGMDVVAWSFRRNENKARSLGFRYVDLPELLSSSDVISVHVRLSNETRGMIGTAEFQAMKPGTILINTARAAVVDTAALANALRSGHLFGAGVDVYDFEPITSEHPLLQCRNIALTPHSADQTQEGLDILTLGCIENIQAFLSGSPINVVNAPLTNSDTQRF